MMRVTVRQLRREVAVGSEKRRGKYHKSRFLVNPVMPAGGLSTHVPSPHVPTPLRTPSPLASRRSTNSGASPLASPALSEHNNPAANALDDKKPRPSRASSRNTLSKRCPTFTIKEELSVYLGDNNFCTETITRKRLYDPKLTLRDFLRVDELGGNCKIYKPTATYIPDNNAKMSLFFDPGCRIRVVRIGEKISIYSGGMNEMVKKHRELRKISLELEKFVGSEYFGQILDNDEEINTRFEILFKKIGGRYC
jgi:hypothetical protein